MDIKRDLSLNRTRISGSEFARNLWVVTVEEGTTREDLRNPAFWSHVSALFKPYDRIEVRSDIDEFFAELLILSCSSTFAKVKELSWFDLPAKDVKLTEEQERQFEYRYRGPHSKHSIVRKHDNAIIF